MISRMEAEFSLEIKKKYDKMRQLMDLQCIKFEGGGV